MKNQALNHKTSKGQALVEYSLILILAVLVVVVVLTLFGPMIGKTYSNVVIGMGTASSTPIPSAVPTKAPAASPTAAPKPSPTPVWVVCAQEHEFCSFIGTKHVRYGKNTTYVEDTFTNGTWCTNAVFGDPLYGTLKECQYVP